MSNPHLSAAHALYVCSLAAKPYVPIRLYVRCEQAQATAARHCLRATLAAWRAHAQLSQRQTAAQQQWHVISSIMSSRLRTAAVKRSAAELLCCAAVLQQLCVVKRRLVLRAAVLALHERVLHTTAVYSAVVRLCNLQQQQARYG
jgi:hypothetical protein